MAGNKKILIDFFRENPCVRDKEIEGKEKHPCFFCGSLIPIFSKRCSFCNLLICPYCKKCGCFFSKEELETIKKIRLKYCCNQKNLEGFEKIEEIEGNKNLIENYTRALQYCSLKIRPERVDKTTPEIIKKWFVFPYQWVKEMNLEGTFLDVGCGEMNFGKELLNSIGVDIANGLETDYIKGDARELPFEDKSFDYVLCFETIEHIKEQKEVVKELVRVARKKVFIGSVNKNGPNFIEGIEIYKGKKNPHHLKELGVIGFYNLFKDFQKAEFYSLFYDKGKFAIKPIEISIDNPGEMFNFYLDGYSNYVILNL